MATPPARTRKNSNLPVIIGLMGVFVVIVLSTIICILFLRLRTTGPNTKQPDTAATQSSVTLPTTSVSTATPGPPLPKKIAYTAQEPIKGYPDCNAFGFYGLVTDSNGNGLQNVQIVVWEAESGLLALNSTDAAGNYSIEIEKPPAHYKLWVQVFEDDVPVSQPVFLETQIDCTNGFQIYQLNWQEITSKSD